MMNIKTMVAQAMVTVTLGMPSSALGQTFYGPTHYYQASDSPFFEMSGLEIEDAEDGVFNLPGASSNHPRMGSSFAYGSVDSVDVDDGSINGTCIDGESFWGSGSITITFGVGGADLPHHAGLVWTDGFGNVTFEAWGPGNVSLGQVDGGNHSNGYGNWWGSTSEDRFYGVSHLAGIEKITVSNPGGIEIDHVQQVVMTPVELILHILDELFDDGTLNNGQYTSLLNKLNHALSKIDSGQLTAGCNQLNAFILQVDALVTDGILTANEGQTLVDAATSISEAAGC